MIIYNDRTRIEIDLNALDHNFSVIRKYAGDTKVMAMVKADAYGHGAMPVATELEKQGVDFFGVANLYEAVSLREGGIKTPILIMGYTLPELVPVLVENDLRQTVQGYEQAEKYSAAAEKTGVKLKVHIKLDTGMSRCGIVCHTRCEDAADEGIKITQLPGLDTEGIYTHFATADEEDERETITQFDDFMAVVNKISEKYGKKLIRHCANSPAMLKYPRMQLDMVRPGLIVYGYSPFDDKTKDEFIPIMTLKTRVEQLKTIPAGTGISYGLTYVTKRPSVIATLSIGYGDGLRRDLTGAEVTVRGKKAPIVGRICMDLCMVDVTDIPDVEVGDEVVIFGPSPNTTAEDLAERAGTISYEIFTCTSKRVMRRYYKDGELQDTLTYV